jgi:hypothetical protein
MDKRSSALPASDSHGTEGGVTQQSDERALIRVHKRSFAIGLLLVVVMSWVAPYVDLVVGQMQTGTLQFAPGAVGAFMIFYGITRAARSVGRLKWMNAGDLLVVYTMLFVGVFVATRGLLEKIIPALAYLNAYSTNNNSYRALLTQHINPNLLVGDHALPTKQFAAHAFFNGLDGGRLPWSAWLVPCASWFLLCVLVISASMCLSTLLRKQWSDAERLRFPLTTLPLLIFDDNCSAALFKNPLTWLGILITFVIYGLNGLHQSLPAVPQIPLQFDNVQQQLTVPPWNNIQVTSIYLSFAAIGIAYLVPTDLLFSFWFFFLLTRFGDVIASGLNLDLPEMASYPTRAYLGFQAAGAYFSLVTVFLYAGRQIYAKTIQDAFRFQIDDEDKHEMMSRRTALWGLIVCYTGIVGWSCWAGMTVWFAALVWLIYLGVTVLVLGRSVAEAGLLMTETTFRPADIVGLIVDPASLGGNNLAPLSLLNAAFFRDTRGLFLAFFTDIQQMAGIIRTNRRSLIPPIALAASVAFIVGVCTHLHLSYSHGATALYSYGTANARSAFVDAYATLNHDRQRFPFGRFWFAVGFIVVLALTAFRGMFAGFPLNPIGYAFAPTYTMMIVWFPIMLVWFIKTVIMRYGGSKAFRQLMPFFLGLIIGEFGSATLWAILASVFSLTAPPLPLGG